MSPTYTADDAREAQRLFELGVTSRKVAERLGLNPNTAKSLSARAREIGWAEVIARAETNAKPVVEGRSQLLERTDVANLPNRRDWWAKWVVQHDDGRLMTLGSMPEKVLAFSCSQAPFHHRDTLPFLAMVIADTKPDAIVMMGDLIDLKHMKKAFTGPDDLSPTQELERAIDFCGQLFRIVPEAICLTSNHLESRIGHAQQQGNIPSAFLRRWQEVVGMPKGWATRDYVVMGRTLFEHGHGVSKGSRSSIREEMIRRFGRPLSVVRGHRHGLFGEAMVPEWEDRTWQRRLTYVGATMDDAQVEYTRSGLWNGCVLFHRGVPIPIPMDRNGKNEWTGRLLAWG